MLVHPDQLVEKCLITRDVYAETNYPIVKKDTIVSATHIKVLKDFLIDEVEVSPRLVNGKPFKLNQSVSVKKERKKQPKVKKDKLSFLDHYLTVVNQYEKIFKQLQSGSPLDIQAVREIIVPLIERVDEHLAEIFLLSKYATKEKYLVHHSVAVSLLATIVAKRLGYIRESTQIAIAALIADSGMARINHRLLKHPGLLSHSDFEEIKKHPTFTYRFIEHNLALTQEAKLGVLQHHERIDGKGYPLGISGEKINIYAKIIAIVDAYHAMTSERFHQEKQPFFLAVMNMRKHENTQFDARLLKVFMTCLEDALLEEKVYLSNGKTGTIVGLRFSSDPEFIVKIHDSLEIISIMDHEQLWVENLIQR